MIAYCPIRLDIQLSIPKELSDDAEEVYLSCAVHELTRYLPLEFPPVVPLQSPTPRPV